MLEEPLLDDETLYDFDEARLDHVNFEACRLHLADLTRVHGQPPARTQPISLGPRGPALPGAVFPQRAVLATLAGKW